MPQDGGDWLACAMESEAQMHSSRGELHIEYACPVTDRNLSALPVHPCRISWAKIALGTLYQGIEGM